MRPLRAPRVDVDVRPGFAAAEARALQTSLHAALTPAERVALAPVPVEAVLDAGRDAARVVLVRNLVVGFVPVDRTAEVDALLARARGLDRRTRVVTRGLLHHDGDLWRVWVGDVPDDGPPPGDDTADTLTPPAPAVLGIPLRHPGA